MFLFTTPATRETAPANPVQAAIQQGAQRTGVNFDYLLKTAQRESALDPDARAKTSSATGLFQFIDQTWLAMVRSEGANHGLGDAARAISQAPDGRLSVADPKLREQIMALRRDPHTASVMAGAFTQRNREMLAGALGREPAAGELYTAHVLGARGATELINAARTAPDRPALQLFPDAAAANRGLFYDRAGRARSASELLEALSAQHRDIAQVQGAQGAQASGPPGGRAGLMGLFSTEGSRAPVSDAVARVWTSRQNRGVQLASLEPAQRFFPNSSDQPQASAGASRELPALPATSLPAPAGRLADAPQPPARPTDLAPSPPERKRARAGPSRSISTRSSGRGA